MHDKSGVYTRYWIALKSPRQTRYTFQKLLRQTVAAIFEKMGVTPEDAAEGADVLVMTDLRAVETHGVSNMLRVYVQDYKAGKLNPAPGWNIVRESPGTAVVDAERRLGASWVPKPCAWRWKRPGTLVSAW